jgi:hypothetical protein
VILAGSYVNHRVLEAFVREPVRVLRVHDSYSVHLEAVRIDIRNYRAESDGPDAMLILCHLSFRCELGTDDY